MRSVPCETKAFCCEPTVRAELTKCCRNDNVQQRLIDFDAQEQSNYEPPVAVICCVWFLVTFFQNGKLIIYDEVGHLPMYEAPERTAQDIRKFFLTQLRLSF